MTQLAARRPPPVGLASLEHWAYSQIKESIITVALPPGSTLVEAQLADQLGVSKTPLRAALLQLEREGFVVSVPYKGSSVAPITLEAVRQLYQLREAVEAYAVYVAVTSFTAEDFAAVEELIATQQRAEEAGNLEEAFLLDRRFHDYFVQRLQNPRFTAIASEMSDHRRRLRYAMAGLRPDCAWVRASHKAILDAVRSGDALTAYRASLDAVRTYLDWVEEAGRHGILGSAGIAERSDGDGKGPVLSIRASSDDARSRPREE